MSETILDASALLALIQAEPGADRVEAVLDDCVILSVNLAEVVGRLQDRGFTDDEVKTIVAALKLPVIAYDDELAIATGLLKAASRTLGLSLGDRACLALANARNAMILSTDKRMAEYGGAERVTLIR